VASLACGLPALQRHTPPVNQVVGGTRRHTRCPLDPRTTYIEAVHWLNVGYQATSSPGITPSLLLGIWNGAPSWAYFGTLGPSQNPDIAMELGPGDTSGKSLGALIYAQQDGSSFESMLAGIGGVVVIEDDPEAPTITGAPSPGFDLSSWLGATTPARISIPASDPGLGVGGVHFSLPAGANANAADQLSCGDVRNRCPNSGPASGTLTGADLPDGPSQPVSAYAQDPVGHRSPLAATWSFKVDHTFPVLSAVGGALHPADDPNDHATPVLPEGTYRCRLQQAIRTQVTSPLG